MRYKAPEYSQILDTKNSEWKKRSCGVIALKTMLDYWRGVSGGLDEIEKLIKEGLDIDAYINDVGWRHSELVELAKSRGFSGDTFDWAYEHPDIAFNKLVPFISKHPVMASIHKNLKEGNSGHLVVITGYEGGNIFYNDPDSEERDDIKRSAPLDKFLEGWKRRIVVIHPKGCKCGD